MSAKAAVSKEVKTVRYVVDIQAKKKHGEAAVVVIDAPLPPGRWSLKTVMEIVFRSYLEIKHSKPWRCFECGGRAREIIQNPMAWPEPVPRIYDSTFMVCRRDGPCKAAVDEFIRSIGHPGHINLTTPGPSTSEVPLAASCAKCHKLVELQKCSRCRLIRYCGRECQKADYDRHKPVCKSIVNVIDNPDPGTVRKYMGY